MYTAALEPSTRRRAAGEMGNFWTRELQRLSQWRSAVWKRWIRHDDVEALAKHRELDKEIKTKARLAQKKGFQAVHGGIRRQDGKPDYRNIK